MNRITFQYTQFNNLNSDGHCTSSTFGYRIYDSYGKEYCNIFDSFEELVEEVNKDNIFNYLYENHRDFYDSAIEDGIEFNDDFIEGEL